MAVVLERKEAEKKEGSKEMGESSSVRVSLGYWRETRLLKCFSSRSVEGAPSTNRCTKDRHSQAARLHHAQSSFEPCVIPAHQSHPLPSVSTPGLGPTPSSHTAAIPLFHHFWVYCCLWDGGQGVVTSGLASVHVWTALPSFLASSLALCTSDTLVFSFPNHPPHSHLPRTFACATVVP